MGNFTCYLFLFIYHNHWISGLYDTVGSFGNLTTGGPPVVRCQKTWTATCFATHVDLHNLVTAYKATHACLQYMLRQRFIPSWLQGNLQLKRVRTINKHSKALWAQQSLGYGGDFFFLLEMLRKFTLTKQNIMSYKYNEWNLLCYENIYLLIFILFLEIIIRMTVLMMTSPNNITDATAYAFLFEQY